MIMTTERRINQPGLSAKEAAFVTGLSEKTINQAIDRAEIQPLPMRRQGDTERMLGVGDLVYLRLRNEVGRLLSAEGKRKLRREIGQSVTGKPQPAAVSLGAIEVTIGPELTEIEQKLAAIAEVRSFVVSDPEVRAGEPVVRGTRISVYMLADLARQGAPTEELLEDYPSLTAESLEAALLYARMYPKRGRPRRTPWKDGVVVSKSA